MRKSIAIIGCQYGDEGKGKIVDYIVSLAAKRIRLDSSIVPSHSNKPILVRRYQGGANAGHTVEDDNDHVYKLHQVPSGIITAEAYNLDGKGMYIHPRKLIKEILGLQAQGVDVSRDNFGIAANAHITLDYHTQDDQASFNLEEHTSTGSGIKQTAVDKYGRVGLRFIEFLDPQLMTEILKEKRFPRGMPRKYSTTIKRLVDSYDAERDILAPYLVMEQDVMKRHGTHLLVDEGANGVGIDIDDGFYPGITSSSAARAPRESKTVIGVLKLYNSSVGGDRPFMSQMPAELETVLRDLWGERGTTTGKDRDLGYFDAVFARYAMDVVGVDAIVGTCGDRMEAFAQVGAKPKLCVAYEIDGRKYDEWHPSFFRRDTLYKAIPVLEEFEPWEKFTDESGSILSKNASKYVQRIESLLGMKFNMLGTGPKRSDIILRGEMLF